MNPVNPLRLDAFMAVYVVKLADNIRTNPSDYAPGSDAVAIAAKMRPAIERGSMNKDSTSFRQTCKVLGIKCTYSGMAAYLSEGTLA